MNDSIRTAGPADESPMSASRRGNGSVSDAAKTYRERSVLTASSQKLVAMLFERSVRELEKARLGLSNGKCPEALRSIEQVQSILTELRASLDRASGGELADRLDRLYEFSLDRLATAQSSQETQPIEEALKALRPLEQAWQSVVAG